MLAPLDIKEKNAEAAVGDAENKDETSKNENLAGATDSEQTKVKVVYKFCDLMKSLITAWKKHFEEYIPDRVQVSS